MELGGRIKSLRQKMGLTQDELAQRSDLTKGFISQLERDHTSPSVENLDHILRALGTNLGDFFQKRVKQTVVHRAKDAFFVEDFDLGHTMTFIVPDAQKAKMEPVVVEIAPGGASKAYTPFEGEAFGYVLKGKLELQVGADKHQLAAGDCFYFEVNDDYQLMNKTKSKAKLLWVLTPPNF